MVEKMTKESIEQKLNEVSEILIKKNKDYGQASFDLGVNGNMVHIWDKSRRYRTLVENVVKNPESVPNFEGLEDTLRDLIGYCVIGLHIIEDSNGKD